MGRHKVIKLTFQERVRLTNEAYCPNCKSRELHLKAVKLRANHPARDILGRRVVYECRNCGYWTDWFDGYTWRPKEMLSAQT